MKTLLIILGLFIPLLIHAESIPIVKVEYFIDIDPGFGNGQNISINQDSVINLDFDVDINRLSLGQHWVYLRAKDKNGFWTAIESKPFVIEAPFTQKIDTQNDFVAYEFFINNDTGKGNGTVVSIQREDAQLVDFNVNASLNSGSINHFFIRAKNSAGIWGPTLSSSYFIEQSFVPKSDSIPQITEVEYFFNTDSGNGKGNLVKAATNSFEFDSLISVNSLNIGSNVLYMRAKNSQNRWGTLNHVEFNIDEKHEITSLQPTSGKAGDSFSLIGLNFAAQKDDHKLFLGSQPVIIDRVNETQTEVFGFVPNMESGVYPVSLEIGGHTVLAAESFTVLRSQIMANTPQLLMSAPVGSVRDTVITIYNTGSAVLNLSKVAFKENRFSVSPSSAQLSPNDSLSLRVQFSPTQRISYRDTLVIESNAPTPFFTIPVVADGLDNEFELSRLILVFNKVQVGQNLEKTITVFNRGNFGGTLAFENPNSSSFSLDFPEQQSVNASDSLVFTVRFNPTTIGLKQDSVFVQIVGKSTRFKVTLLGEAMSSGTPFLAVNEKNLHLPLVGPGGTSSRGLWLFNRSELSVRLDSLSDLSEPFSMTELEFPLEIPSFDSLRINISASSTLAGIYTDTLSIYSYAGLEKVLVSVEVTKPQLSVSNLTYVFEEVAVGDSVESTITLKSVGNLDARLLEVRFSSLNFSLMPVEGRLADSVKIRFHFVPRTFGEFSDTLKIITDGDQLFAYVSGKSPIPNPESVQKEVHYENTEVGVTQTKRLALLNKSINADIVQKLLVDNANVTVELEANRSRIVRGDTTWIQVSYTPTSIEALNDTLRIVTQSGNVLKIGLSSAVATSRETSTEVLTFALQQNYPNPFNPSTTIRYSIAKASNVRLTVFNLIGQKVAVLINQPMNAGNYTAQFDASALSSGMYFYRLDAGEFSETRKMLLVK